jgi:hypothetical protein
MPMDFGKEVGKLGRRVFPCFLLVKDSFKTGFTLIDPVHQILQCYGIEIAVT